MTRFSIDESHTYIRPDGDWSRSVFLCEEPDDVTPGFVGNVEQYSYCPACGEEIDGWLTDYEDWI